MASPVLQIYRSSASADTPEKKAGATANASAGTAASPSASPAGVPRDTVTISEEAATLVSNAPANGTTEAGGGTLASPGAGANGGSATSLPANAASSTVAANTAIASTILLMAQQIQQLATQGLSVDQIALELNLPASIVALYISSGQSSGSTALG